MMRHLFAFLTTLPALWLAGQDTTGVRSSARLTIDTLAAPGMHGRGYVAGGDSIAAEYIAARFAKAGLLTYRDERFQPFTFAVNTFPGAMSVALDGRTLEPGVDYLVDPASGGAQGRYELVNVTPGDMATRARKSMTMGVVTGKAVRFEPSPSEDPDTLARNEALVRELLMLSPVLRRSPQRLMWGVAGEALRNPLVEVDPEAWPDSAEVVDLHVEQRLVPRHRARNVWGLVKGRSSKRMVLVTAHYDHLGRMGTDTWFPGANDNASGTAMLISLAEHFARNKPRYDMLFIAFAGEEAGLKGSFWTITDRAVDLAKVRMVVNLDILGTGDDGITVVNATEIPKEFALLQDMNARHGGLPQVKSRGPACNSDHCPFVMRGVPGMFIYTLGGEAHYHDVYDRAETLSLKGFPGLYATLIAFIDALK
jgi:hypothetical protein